MKRPHRLKATRDAVAELRRRGRPVRWVMTWHSLPEAIAGGDARLADPVLAAFRHTCGEPDVPGYGRGCASCGTGWTWAKLPARVVAAELLGGPAGKPVMLAALLCEPCTIEAARDRDEAESRFLRVIGCQVERAEPIAASGRA